MYSEDSVSEPLNLQTWINIYRDNSSIRCSLYVIVVSDARMTHFEEVSFMCRPRLLYKSIKVDLYKAEIAWFECRVFHIDGI